MCSARTYVYVPHACRAHRGQNHMYVVPTEGRRELGLPGTGVAESCALLCRYWERNRGSPARVVISLNRGATSPASIK